MSLAAAVASHVALGMVMSVAACTSPSSSPDGSCTKDEDCAYLVPNPPGPDYEYCAYKVADGCNARGVCAAGNKTAQCPAGEITYCICGGGIATDRTCGARQVDYVRHPFGGECYPDGGPVP